MNKKDFDTTIRRQTMSLVEMVDGQVDHCFDRELLKALIPDGADFTGRNVIMTGAGDSWAAAGAMRPMMSRYLDLDRCFAPDPMEFCRVMTAEDMGCGEKNKPLLIAITVGGGTARVTEAIEKGYATGCDVIVLTNKPESRAGKACKKVFPLALPPTPDRDIPGLRSYFACLIALAALAYRIGVVRGMQTDADIEIWKKNIKAYVKSYDMEAMDNQLFELANSWKTFEKFDFIGDDAGFFSALFGIEKFYEMCGALSDFDDSENWNHINGLLAEPEKVGTVLNIDKRSNSYNRINGTANFANLIGRPVLVVTDGDASVYNEGVTVCSIPSGPEGFEWMMALMDWTPASLLAGYVSRLGKHTPFSSYDETTGVFNPNTPFNDPSVVTRGSSEVQVHH